jgi:hypothetical protein
VRKLRVEDDEDTVHVPAQNNLNITSFSQERMLEMYIAMAQGYTYSGK